MAALREGFVESDLPFRVDLVEEADLTPSMRDMFLADSVRIRAAEEAGAPRS